MPPKSMPWMALLPDCRPVPRPCSGRPPAGWPTLPRSAGGPWGPATGAAACESLPLCARPCLSHWQRHPKPLPVSSNSEVCADQEEISRGRVTYGKTHGKLRSPLSGAQSWVVARQQVVHPGRWLQRKCPSSGLMKPGV